MSAERAMRHLGDQDVVGTVHCFGEHGPAYEVLALDEDREGSVLVRLVETGETLSYSVAHVRADPEA